MEENSRFYAVEMKKLLLGFNDLYMLLLIFDQCSYLNFPNASKSPKIVHSLLSLAIQTQQDFDISVKYLFHLWNLKERRGWFVLEVFLVLCPYS